ncbi:hypothetical protein SDC9_158109 [bioreactor metagenome]|uniref:Ribosome-binding factor A n=1 Tax=bioreactor metagenome TaxID=1076179 RepID=A0A645FB72_9ZZZZ
MRIRAVPSMKFMLDNTIAYSVRISEILNGLHKSEDSMKEDDAHTDEGEE